MKSNSVLVGIAIGLVLASTIFLFIPKHDTLPTGSEVVLFHWGGGTTTLTPDQINYNPRTKTVHVIDHGLQVGHANLLGRHYGYIVYCPARGDNPNLNSILFELIGESADYHERTAQRSLMVAKRHMELYKGWNSEQKDEEREDPYTSDKRND